MRSDKQIAGLFQAEGSPYRDHFAWQGRPLKTEELSLVLDLQQAGLESVRTAFAAGKASLAARELLTYFRNRAQVAWPAWPAMDNSTSIHSSVEKEPSSEPPPGQAKASALPPLALADNDRTIAANALTHIFQSHPSHAPHNYGPDINWDEDPYDAIEWTSGMHRMHGWDLAVARCYSAAKDPVYARLWVNLTGDWIRKNPVTRERCHFAKSWDSIQVGFRARGWCGLFPYFLNAPDCGADFLVELLTALYNHARRIVVLPYPNPDNFLIIESAALADIALTFPEFLDAGEWREIAFQRLSETLSSQVLPDGVHHELALSYHLYCALLYLNVIDLARRNGFDPPFSKAVENMAEAVFGLASPLRWIPVVGDSLRPDARRVLMCSAQVFSRGDFLAAATDGAKGIWPEQRNFAFPSGGFYAFRSDWTKEAIWLSLHCGPPSGDPTACHAQPDNGTFELAAYGRYLMRDPGVYSYNWKHPEERAPFRATSAHQTLTLNGLNSARAGRYLHWVADDGQGNAHLTVENVAYPGLTHRRTVFFVALRFFVLVDEALGNAVGTLDLHFRLTPGPARPEVEPRGLGTLQDSHAACPDRPAHRDSAAWRIEAALKRAWTAFPTGGNVLVWAEPTAQVTLREEEGWFSPWFKVKEPLPAFAYRHSQNAPARFLTLLVPFEGQQPPEVSARISSGEIGSAALSIVGRVAGADFQVQRVISKEKL